MGSLGIAKEQRNMVIVLIVGALLVVLNQTLLSPALPSIMVHLNVDATTVQWLTSAYALTEAIVIPLAAWFMGHVSTRKLFMGGLALFGAGSLVAAIAPAFAVLLLGRIMQALATGVLMVMVMSLVLLVFPRERRGQAMGLVGLVISFAPAIGPSVGGLLVDLVGWRALFCVVVVCTALIILFASRALVNYEGFPRTSADAPSIVLSCLGLASVLYGLSSFASSSHVLVCAALIVVGLVLIGLFVRRQFKLEEPMLRLEVLKSRRYRTGLVAIACLQAALIGLGVLMPLYIQDVLGFSATVSGLTTLPGAVLGAFAGLLGGRVFDRMGIRQIALIGGVVMVAGSAGMFCYGAHSSLVLVTVIYAVVCIGLQLLITPTNTWGVNSLDNELVQHATSVTNTMNQVGGSLGTALIMSFSALGSSLATQSSGVEQLFAGYHMSFGVILVLAIVVFAIVLIGVRDKKDDKILAAENPTPSNVLRYSVADIMNAEPLTLSVGLTIGEAVQVLAERNASGAVVVEEDGTVRGFLSNGDVLRLFGDAGQSLMGTTGIMAARTLDNESLHASAERLHDLPVGEVSVKRVVGISPDASFEEACAVLAERRFKTLPVIDDGKLVGIVHRHDLMRLLAGVFEDAAASEGEDRD